MKSLEKCILLLLILLLVACDTSSGTADDDEPNILQENITVPIEKARGLSDVSDERNADLEDALNDLEEE